MIITQKHRALRRIYHLLHDFQYGLDTMKQWVRDDETQVGNYHDDWLWLMPIVEKIEEVQDADGNEFAVNIIAKRCRIEKFDQDGEYDGFIGDGWYEGKDKIDAVYQACADFADWYFQNC